MRKSPFSNTYRDYQRDKFYEAQNVTFHLFRDLPEFVSVQVCQDFVDLVTTSPWFLKNLCPYKSLKIKVHDGRGRQSAEGGWNPITGFYIKAPREFRRIGVLLEEIAHTIRPAKASWHGREFAATYLKLVRYFMGTEKAKELKEAYQTYGVEFRGKDITRAKHGKV